MKVEWHEHLSVGVAEIDLQHKQLIEHFNVFLAACETEKGSEEIRRLFWFLSTYIVVHFADEERLQKRIGFPDYLKHQNQHQEFTRKVAELKERFTSEGPSPGLNSTVAITVTGWLIEHISRSDRAIGQFLKEQEKGKAFTGHFSS
jgi:hemerythrin